MLALPPALVIGMLSATPVVFGLLFGLRLLAGAYAEAERFGAEQPGFVAAVVGVALLDLLGRLQLNLSTRLYADCSVGDHLSRFQCGVSPAADVHRVTAQAAGAYGAGGLHGFSGLLAAREQGARDQGLSGAGDARANGVQGVDELANGFGDAAGFAGGLAVVAGSLLVLACADAHALAFEVAGHRCGALAGLPGAERSAGQRAFAGDGVGRVQALAGLAGGDVEIALCRHTQGLACVDGGRFGVEVLPGA